MKCQNVLKRSVRKKRPQGLEWPGRALEEAEVRWACRLSVTALQRVTCPPLGPAFPLPIQSLSSEDFQKLSDHMFSYNSQKSCPCLYPTNTSHREYDQHGPGPWSFWSNKCIAVMCSLAPSLSCPGLWATQCPQQGGHSRVCVEVGYMSGVRAWGGGRKIRS